MLNVITQGQTACYRIRFFYLKHVEDHYDLIGSNDETKELVKLAEYKYYKQAIDVFGLMDYQDNDLFYYKTDNKLFYLPENITDEQMMLQIYGSLY